MKRRRNSLYLYLILNVLVSAATTLTVLVLWDRARGPQPAPASTQVAGDLPAARPTDPAPLLPVETNPPPGEPVIQILSVVGIDDLEQEVVTLKRVGEGNLRMAGWKLQGEHNNTYTFPESSQLVLYKDGAVQVFSKGGEDTVTAVYWNRSSPAWRSGESIVLLDEAGSERARYRIP